MIATHPNEVSRLIARHVRRTEAALNGESMFSGFYEPRPRT
jgi:hypothetical protein